VKNRLKSSVKVTCYIVTFVEVDNNQMLITVLLEVRAEKVSNCSLK